LNEKLLRALRYAVLQHLAVHGARTVDELAQAPPELLELPLDRSELATAIDSLRRHRAIEPLDVPEISSSEPEWGLTEFGRTRASSLFARILDSLKGLLPVVGFFGGALLALVTAAFGVNFDLKALEPGTASFALAAGVLCIEAMIMVVVDYRYGVSRRAIVRAWPRYQLARPHGYRLWTQRPFALGTVLLGTALCVVLLVSIDRGGGEMEVTSIGGLVSVLLGQLWVTLLFVGSSTEARTAARTLPSTQGAARN